MLTTVTVNTKGAVTFISKGAFTPATLVATTSSLHLLPSLKRKLKFSLTQYDDVLLNNSILLQRLLLTINKSTVHNHET